MGCNTSKHDDLAAVALCRHRCNFLADALHHSNALAESHVAYMNSLKTLGTTLHHFFNQKNLDNNHADHHHKSNGGDPPPKIPSPRAAASPDHHSTSSSTSDNSHIKFDTDSDDDNNHIESLNDDFMSLYSVKNQQTQTQSSSYNYFPNHGTHRSFDGELSEFAASKTTPPPPAPSSSAWDFLNFFDTYERYELPYTVTVISKEEAKDKERIRESKKEINNGAGLEEKKSEEKVDADAVDKKVKTDNEGKNESENTGRNVSVAKVMREIEVLFERASESGIEVLKTLDAGKLRYYLRKNSVASRVGSGYDMGFDEDLVVNARNLSITLKKLCMWEKKLYDEVKAEEKLRKLHASKCRQMKSFEHKGADAQKLDSLQILVTNLSTKIKIAIQVIDKISITINKLRDEELWPQINELINRLLVMWKAMLDCHRSQSGAVVEAKNLDAVSSIQKLDDAQLEAAIQLKMELQSWNVSFCNWVDAQKGYVKALNGWLLKCLLHEPEETPDGIAPFSPGRIGAPSVFVICHQWSQAMDKVSEKDVTKSMHGFLISVNQLLKRHNVELQQRVIADKNMERRVKILEREEQKMLKLMQARRKKIVLMNGEENDMLFLGDRMHQSGVTNTSSLHTGLTQIFSSMEKLASNFAQAYEELQARIEEGRHAQKNPGGP